MLYLFDLDGTLISGYMDNPDKDYHTWHVLPGRVERLAQLHNADHHIGIVTNQGAVAFGYIQPRDAERKLIAAIDALGIPFAPLYVCYADKRSANPIYQDDSRRKPSGMMIREAIADYEQWYGLSPEVIFIGDRQEDRDAALDAGVRFVWSNDFFNE